MSPGSGNISAPCSHGAPLTEASRGTCHACAFSKAMQSRELSFPSASCKLWWSILHCGLGSWSAVLTTQWLQVVTTVQSQGSCVFFPTHRWLLKDGTTCCLLLKPYAQQHPRTGMFMNRKRTLTQGTDHFNTDGTTRDTGNDKGGKRAFGKSQDRANFLTNVSQIP